MAKGSAKPRRQRVRQQARRESARAWVARGSVSVDAFARRYGVDCYTAYADLTAIGLRLASRGQPLGGSATPALKRPRAEPADVDDG